MVQKRYTVRDECGGVFAYEAVNRRHAIVLHAMARTMENAKFDPVVCVLWTVSDGSEAVNGNFQSPRASP